MGVKVARLEDLASHYEGVLQQSDAARKVLRSWGLNATAELREVRAVREELLNKLAAGDVEV